MNPQDLMIQGSRHGYEQVRQDARQNGPSPRLQVLDESSYGLDDIDARLRATISRRTGSMQ